MVRSFNTLLRRADDELLQELVGPGALRLLGELQPNLLRPSQLREVIRRLHPPAQLLRDPRTRARLLELLRPGEAEELARELGLSTQDPFAALRSLRIRRGSRLEALLFLQLGLEPPEAIHSTEPSRRQSSRPSYGLFDHQRAVVHEVRKALGAPPHRVMLHLPTGGGKTRCAMHLISSALSEAEPCLVAWLAYSDELCEQAAGEFERAWTSLGNRAVDVVRYWGAGPELDISDLHDGFIVAGLSKLYARARRDSDFLARLSDRTRLAVIDEAHQSLAPTYHFLLDYLTGRDDRTAFLGLSATPGRTWNDPEEDRRLARLFAGRKVMLKTPGYRSPVDYLVANGYLAQARFRTLPYVSQQKIPPSLLEKLATSLDVPTGVLRILAEDEKRNLLILGELESLLTRHRRVLVFAASVEHARLLAVALQLRGHNATAVTASTDIAERRAIIDRFRRDAQEPMVLCNYGVFTAGFDAPGTSAALIARPTRSLVLYSQMIGRAIRGPRAGGNEQAEIVTVVDTALPGFSSVSDAFLNWEDVWDDSSIA